MLLGHFGLAMIAKRWTSGVSLGVLFLAAQWADLLWPVLVLADVERVAIDPGITAFTPLYFAYYPWSHSLLMGVVWGALLGAAYYGWRRRWRDALFVGALVPSHWLLDLVVHRPDLPLWPGGPEVGLGLWNSVPGTLFVELGLFAVGVLLYLSVTRERDGVGEWGAYGLVGLLLVVYLGSAFGPAPADPTTVALAALALWIVVLLAAWIDDHRDDRPVTGGSTDSSPPTG